MEEPNFSEIKCCKCGKKFDIDLPSSATANRIRYSQKCEHHLCIRCLDDTYNHNTQLKKPCVIPTCEK
jgi:hypothetical protein